MATQKYTISDLLVALNGARQAAELIRGFLQTAKENQEMTPEQEAAWLADEQAFRASPAGTPTAAGKL